MNYLIIVGYIIAALVIALGLYLIFKKNAETTPADDMADDARQQLDAAEDLNRIPVVPRAVREQLQDEQLTSIAAPMSASRAAPDVEVAAPVVAAPVAAPVPVAAAPVALKVEQVTKPTVQDVPDALDEALAQLEAVTQREASDDVVPAIPDVVEANTTAELEVALDEPVAGSLKPAVETASVDQWEGESALLEAHLQDQERRDDETALAQAEHILSLYVMPAAGRTIAGDKVMQLLRQFGLRFGEMSLFHRFQDSNGTGPLMFSVLRYTSEGPMGFDLETLSSEHVEGLAFFLALPNKHALAGYDMMVSISGLLAREVAGRAYDEQMNELTPQLREHYRHFVMDYRGSY